MIFAAARFRAVRLQFLTDFPGGAHGDAHPLSTASRTTIAAIGAQDCSRPQRGRASGPSSRHTWL